MMDYKTLYPWAPSNLLDETSKFTTCEKIMLYRKSEHPKKKCLFGREDDKYVKVVSYRVDEPVCCDESSDPEGLSISSTVPFLRRFSNLKLIFDTVAFIKHEFSAVGLKAYIGILLSLTLASDILHVCVTEFYLFFHVNSMLILSKKDLAARAKQMKVVAQASLAKDLKLKAVVEVATSDERIRAQGLSLREDERMPLCLLSIQPQMVGLPHYKSLHPVLPLLEILGCRRVGDVIPITT